MGRSGLTRLFGLAALIGVVTTLTGCNTVSKKQYDALMQENAELREANSRLEQSSREKDLRLAAMESTGDSGAPYGGSSPTRRSGGGDTGVFHRRDDGSMAAVIAGNVLFDSGSATLKPGAKKELDQVAAAIKRNYANARIRVEGHTDSDPIKKSKWPSNDALSQARAEAVEKYLSSKGISGTTAVGYGSSRPKGTKAESRRVEIVIAG